VAAVSASALKIAGLKRVAPPSKVASTYPAGPPNLVNEYSYLDPFAGLHPLTAAVRAGSKQAARR
jgi:hypothetical protein